MKLSLNQLRHNQEKYKWSDDVLSIGVDKLIDKIGSQLGAIEGISK